MNFSNFLINKISKYSELIHAPSGEIYNSEMIKSFIAKSAGFLNQNGIKPGDRIILGTNLTPLSSIVYLSSIYAGVIPVPIEIDQLIGKLALYKEITDAKAIWIDENDSIEDDEEDDETEKRNKKRSKSKR